MREETEAAEGDLSPERAAELHERGEAQIVDVRQPDEWEAGRIPGAIHIPLDELPARTGEIDTERIVIFQCRGGGRSAMAANAFRASGVEAHNLAGGLVAWVELGLEIEPAEGTVADGARPDNT